MFGGSKKVIDQGIVIFGGALNDMLNGIAVGAYQTIHKSGGLLGSGSTKDQTQSVPDEFTRQFQLVIGSITEAVKQGATALGVSEDQINAAIAAFHVAEQHISLQGLSAEDQQKALEAVFSSIFDGLAGAVVPFIGQFQKVGEGLGETLVRVATEVQVTQQAMKSLGLAISATDPEKFAQIADALTTAVGGIDNFISGMNSFVDRFASDKDKFALEKDALNSAFSQVGLAIPATREGMYELMKSLDASTDAGRAQIATLLQLVDVADQYYSALEKTGGSYAEFIAQFKTGPLTDFQKAVIGLGQSLTDNIAKANELAIANGQSGASAEDIGAIIAASVTQGVAALRQLQSETATIAGQLFGTTLDKLKAQEAEFEKTGLIDFERVKKINDLENQQSAQQQLQQAVGLIGNFGQIGAITGQTLEELAKEFNVPLDKLATLLGTDGEGLQKDFSQQVDAAKAALETAKNTEYTNHLLADILAQSQGKPLPYSTSQLQADATGTHPTQSVAPSGKLGTRLFAPPSTVQLSAAAPASSGNAQPGNPSDAETAIAEIPATLQQGNDRLIQRLDQMMTELGAIRQTMNRFGVGTVRPN